LVTFTDYCLAGLAGSLFDSLLGATVQAMYYCPTDKKETEKHPLHTCGTETVHIRGWKWLDNDWVNFACSAFRITQEYLNLILRRADKYSTCSTPQKFALVGQLSMASRLNRHTMGYEFVTCDLAWCTLQPRGVTPH
jgi:hypothetical protein